MELKIPSAEPTIAEIEKSRNADIVKAMSTFLSGYRNAAEKTGHQTDGVSFIILSADEHEVRAKVGEWKTETELLAVWEVEIESDSGDLLSEKPSQYMVTLVHIPPGKEESDPRSFRLDFIVSPDNGVTKLDISHPLSQPENKREVERSTQKGTIEYGIRALTQIGRLLSNLPAGSEPTAQ